jgi:hypothetical protein
MNRHLQNILDAMYRRQVPWALSVVSSVCGKAAFEEVLLPVGIFN